MRTARKKGQGVQRPGDPDLYRDRALKGGRASKARAAVFMVEGETVTFAKMAERLGVSEPTAKNRYAKTKTQPGPVTWKGLGL